MFGAFGTDHLLDLFRCSSGAFGNDHLLDLFRCSSVGGVTVSMVAFQAVDPGSTPGRRTRNFVMVITVTNNNTHTTRQTDRHVDFESRQTYYFQIYLIGNNLSCVQV